MTGEFITSDVDLAAYIRCKGIRYVRIQPTEDRDDIAEFVFPEGDDLFAALVEWHRDTAMHQFARQRRKFYQLARKAVEGTGA